MRRKKRRHDRKVREGIDYEKLAKIWSAIGDWIHVAEISRRTKIHESTVRWYLDKYLSNAIQEERIAPTIKLRLVKLKPNMDLKSYIRALELIEKVKGKT